jgi:hypothetical protein
MKILKIATVVGALAAAGPASAFVLEFNGNWGFDPTGPGAGGAVQPIDEMTYLGVSFTDTDPTVAGGAGTIDAGDTFTDVGRLGATGFQNDGSPIPASTSGVGVDYELSAAFLDWTGTYGATTGSNTAFTFTPGGTLTIYIDTVLDNTSFDGATNGTPIMELSILQGTGNINFGNPGGIDGNVNILFEVTSVAQGYWLLDTDGNGTPDTDAYDILAGGAALVVGLTDSNNNIFTPTDAVIADFLATTGLTVDSAGDIYTLNDGSFELGTSPIPAPATLGLLGLGLMGLGLVRRRAA